MRQLLVCHTIPWPAAFTGGAQRTGLIWQAMRELGEVDLLLVHREEFLARESTRAFVEDPANRVAGTLALQGLSLRPQGWGRMPGPPGAIAREIRRLMYAYTPPARPVDWHTSGASFDDYDLIACRYLGTACRAGLNAPHLASRTVIDVDDLDWQKLRSQYAVESWPGARGRLYLKGITMYFERFCRSQMRRFAHLWVAAEEDLESLPTPRRSVLPNVPIVSGETSPPGPDARTCLFLGDMTYEPNSDGLGRFLKAVWPAVRDAVPDATLEIAGVRISDEQTAAWSKVPGVRVLGFVEDLDEPYRRCAVLVAPIYWGGGTKIKVLEAMARHRTVVGPEHALRGLPPEAGDAVSAVDDDNAFAASVIALLRNPDRARERGIAAAAVARKHFSPSVFSERVVADLRAVAARTVRGAA
jgi:glycosyltransferase involved in cell wall biosynthesis